MKLKDFKSEIKVLDIAALIVKAKALKIEISDLVMDKNISKLKNLKSISKKKKDLARILTTLTQKQMIGQLESKESEATKESKVEKTEKVKKGEK